MRRLTPLPNNLSPTHLDWYIAIRDKKHKATRIPLIAAHSLIEKQYIAHAQAMSNGSLKSLRNNTKLFSLKEILRACYDGPTHPLRQLKQAIRDAQPKRFLKYCPMCGTTLPRTFDHYMPAVIFPEFAVHPLNLVPCCSTCNSTKDDDWLSAAGDRQFLYAYADAIPDLQFLMVTLHEDPLLAGVGATFSIKKPAKMDSKLWKLIDSHFCRLKLIERYNELSNDEIAEILTDCRVFLDAGGQNVQQFLVERAKDRLSVYGTNHWIGVLMNAIAKHPKLSSWVKMV